MSLTWHLLPRTSTQSHAQSASSEQPRAARGSEGTTYGIGNGGASANNHALQSGSFRDSLWKGPSPGGARGGAGEHGDASPMAATRAQTRQRARVDAGVSSCDSYPAQYAAAASRWREAITGEEAPEGSQSARSLSSLLSLKANEAARIAVGKPHHL